MNNSDNESKYTTEYLIECIKVGLSVAEVASVTGLSRQRIYQRLRSAKFQALPRETKDVETRAKTLELWKTGLSNRAIARELNSSSEKIGSILKEEGLEPHGRKIEIKRVSFCVKCRREKPVSEFYSRGEKYKYLPNSWCRECQLTKECQSCKKVKTRHEFRFRASNCKECEETHLQSSDGVGSDSNQND